MLQKKIDPITSVNGRVIVCPLQEPVSASWRLDSSVVTVNIKTIRNMRIICRLLVCILFLHGKCLALRPLVGPECRQAPHRHPFCRTSKASVPHNLMGAAHGDPEVHAVATHTFDHNGARCSGHRGVINWREVSRIPHRDVSVGPNNHYSLAVERGCITAASIARERSQPRPRQWTDGPHYMTVRHPNVCAIESGLAALRKNRNRQGYSAVRIQLLQLVVSNIHDPNVCSVKEYAVGLADSGRYVFNGQRTKSDFRDRT